MACSFPPFLALLLYLSTNPAIASPITPATPANNQPFNFTYPQYNNPAGNSQFSYKDNVTVSWTVTNTTNSNPHTLAIQCRFANNSDPNYYATHPPQYSTNLHPTPSPNTTNAFNLSLAAYKIYNVCSLLLLFPDSPNPNATNATTGFPVFYISTSNSYGGGKVWDEEFQATLNPYGPLMGSLTAGMWGGFAFVLVVVGVMVGVAGY